MSRRNRAASGRLTPESTEGIGAARETSRLPTARRPYKDQDPFNTTWESPEAMCEYLESVYHSPDGTWTHSETNHAGRDYDWAWGFRSSQAVELMRRGWKDGASQVGQAHINAANTALSEHLEDGMVYDVTGSFVDVGAFLSGQPECMVDFASVPREIRSVRIVVDSFCSMGISADLLFARGVAIMAAILSAQASGIAVTVEMACRKHMEGSGRIGQYSVTLHRPGDTLDTARLVYCLAHPAFNRMIHKEACASCAGVESSSDAGGLASSAGVVFIPGVVMSSHEWGDAESNKILIEKIFAAAI